MVEIDLPIEKTVTLWENSQYFAEWQDGFISIELLEGVENRKKAKSRILFQRGKGEVELFETILQNDLPEKKVGLYEHVHMTNTQITSFQKISDQQTRYTSEVEYVKFNGFMPKMLGILMPRMFVKQSQKRMEQFKVFAEKKAK